MIRSEFFSRQQSTPELPTLTEEEEDEDETRSTQSRHFAFAPATTFSSSVHQWKKSGNTPSVVIAGDDASRRHRSFWYPDNDLLDDDLQTDGGGLKLSHVVFQRCEGITVDDDDSRSNKSTHSSMSGVASALDKDEEDTYLASTSVTSGNGTFESVLVQNSKDVHFGNKIFQAPVTVVNRLGNSKDETDAACGAEQPICTKRRACLIACCSLLGFLCLATGIYLKLWTPGDLVLHEPWFYPRSSWQARDAVSKSYFYRAVSWAVIGHTVTHACSTHAACTSAMRCMQNMHMDQQQFEDIAYNYVVGGDGGVYVGRGAVVMGQHTYGLNYRSLGVAFVGDYSVLRPTAAQLEHAKMLLEAAVQEGFLTPDYVLVGQCQVVGVASPGYYLWEAIQEWPHWNRSTCDVHPAA